MLRIIAGSFRGRSLIAPPGEATRPTAARVREALFSMLISRLGSFKGLRVADVFAGTGALGLEALSRGCAAVTFVETGFEAVKSLRANITKLGVEAVTSVVAQPAQSVAPWRTHDLLLLDPPYGEGLATLALARLIEQGWVAPHALLSVETGAREPLAAPGFTIEATRVYGKAALHLLRLAPTAA